MAKKKKAVAKAEKGRAVVQKHKKKKKDEFILWALWNDELTAEDRKSWLELSYGVTIRDLKGNRQVATGEALFYMVNTDRVAEGKRVSYRASLV